MALALSQMGVRHHLFTIMSLEDKMTVRRRHAFAKQNRSATGLQSSTIVRMKQTTYKASRSWLKEHAERYDYNSWCPPTTCGAQSREYKWDPSKVHDFRDDSGMVGTSHICELAYPLGVRVYMSAMGPDELYSDYEGKAPWSDFGGKFPADLASIWPWNSFFNYSMHFYVKGAEYVTGAHGMEGRYPFLDVDLVQEFLWLTPELKNKRFKHPIYTYMNDSHYPVHPTMAKLPFAARKAMGGGRDLMVRRSTESIMAQRHEITQNGTSPAR